MNKITTIHATESMKDSLAKETIQKLTRGTEVEAILVKEVSLERERNHSRDHSDGRENYKKSKSVKSNNNWMSSNGEELSGSENSES